MALGTQEKPVIWLDFKGGTLNYNKNGTRGSCKYVEGVITEISYKQEKFKWEGKDVEYRSIRVKISDGDEDYVITEKVDSKAGRQLQLKLLNTSVGDRLKISPSNKDADGKKVDKATGVFVNINESPVHQKYSASNPGNCPAWEKIVVKGKEQYDNTKELQFLEREMLEHFKNAKAVEVASSAGEFHDSEIPTWDDSPADGETPF